MVGERAEAGQREGGKQKKKGGEAHRCHPGRGLQYRRLRCALGEVGYLLASATRRGRGVLGIGMEGELKAEWEATREGVKGS